MSIMENYANICKNKLIEQMFAQITNIGGPCANTEIIERNLFVTNKYCYLRKPFLRDPHLQHHLEEILYQRNIEVFEFDTDIDTHGDLVKESWIPSFIAILFNTLDFENEINSTVVNEKTIEAILYEFASAPIYYNELPLETRKEKIKELIYEFQQAD